MEAKDIHIQEMLPIWAAFPVCMKETRNLINISLSRLKHRAMLQYAL
jgi:hypothetical protein